nr:reverse transcriptase domain-containing protein [Tanacetum cinerariifolium]
MDDPNITIEEYIQLEAERAPIVYIDTLTSEPKVSYEPTLSAHHVKKPMYAPPNMLVYPGPASSFADSIGSVTPFVRWIEDYPLPDGLKMPSHIGSYDGKGDPYNFLHLFEGAIRMQKWLMPDKNLSRASLHRPAIHLQGFDGKKPTPGSKMSTLVFVDPEIFTQADGAQSSRVPVPLPEDPYKAIRQAYLVGTDTESEPFEDPVETETPKSPHTVASPTSLLDSTPPTCRVKESKGSDTSGARSTSSNSTAPLSPDHPLTHSTPTLVSILCKTARMVVRVLPVMSPGLSVSIAEVAAMSDSALCKRFRSSYESSPSSSPPDLPLRKRYQGTSELVEDEEEEDKETEESLYSDCESEDAKDEGPIIEDKDPTARDEGLAARDEGPGEPLGLGYGALRNWKIALEEGWMPIVFEVDPEDGISYIDVPAYPPPAPPVQTPPLPEWLYGSLPISPAPSIVSSPISSLIISLTVPSLVASHATAEAEGFLTELGT